MRRFQQSFGSLLDCEREAGFIRRFWSLSLGNAPAHARSSTRSPARLRKRPLDESPLVGESDNLVIIGAEGLVMSDATVDDRGRRRNSCFGDTTRRRLDGCLM